MASRMVVPKENALVTRHNALIESSYTLSLTEKKILLWLLSEIQPEDKDFQPMRVSLAALCNFIGIESANNRYDYIRPIIEKLKKKSAITIDGHRMNGEKGSLVTSWFSSAFISEDGKTASFTVDPQLKPYLLDLKANFTSIKTRYAILLDGFYAIRIYELICQYRSVGKREISVERLRTILGIDEKKFKLFGDFRRYVLDRAEAQTKQKADLTFTYEMKKTGRKVTDIIFHIHENTPEVSLEVLEKADTPEGRARFRLLKLGLSDSKSRKWVEEKGHEYVEGNAQIIEDRIRAGKAENPVALLQTALKEDWREQTTLFEQEEQAKRDEEKRKKKEALERAERELKEKEEKKREEDARIMGEKVERGKMYFYSLTEDEQQELLDSFFEDPLIPQPIKKWLSQDREEGNEEGRGNKMFYSRFG